MVDLVQIECVEGVLRTGSFRGASREVYLSQPAVSAHINRLERELGLTLFDRGRDGTRLTAAGARMLPHLRAFTASATALRQASDHVKANVDQTLTVYSYRTGLIDILPPAFRMLNESFDPMHARFVEATRDEMVTGLVSGKCDLALDTQLGPLLDDPAVEATELIDAGPALLIGRHGHPLLEVDGRIDLARIGDVPLVMQAMLEPFLLPLLPEGAARRLTLAPDAAAALALYDAGAELAIVGMGYRVSTDPAIRLRAIVGSPHVRSVVIKAAGATLSPPAAALHAYLVAWGEQSQRNSIIDSATGWRRARSQSDEP